MKILNSRLGMFLPLLLLVWGCDAPPALEYTNPADPMAKEAVPLPPINVVLKSSSKAGYQLVWDDQSSFATGYLIERLPGRRGATLPDTILTTVRSLTETGMDTTITYTYRVHATYQSRASRSSIPVKIFFSSGKIFSSGLSGDVRVVSDAKGRFFATCNNEPCIRIWSADSLKPIDTFNLDGFHMVTSFCISPESDVIAVAVNLRSVLVFNFGTHSLLYQFDGCYPYPLQFSPDGKTLAFAMDGGKLLALCTIADGTVSTPLSSFPKAIRSIIFSPDGKYLITSSDDAKIRIHDIAQNFKIVNTMSVPLPAPYLAMSSDGLLLSASSYEGGLYTWKMSDLSTPLSILPAPKTEVYFLPRTHLLPIVNVNSIRLVNADNGAIERTTPYSDWPLSHAAAADGRILVIVGSWGIQILSTGEYWWMMH